jgi:hypothetical protein
LAVEHLGSTGLVGRVAGLTEQRHGVDGANLVLMASKLDEATAGRGWPQRVRTLVETSPLRGRRHFRCGAALPAFPHDQLETEIDLRAGVIVRRLLRPLEDEGRGGLAHPGAVDADRR